MKQMHPRPKWIASGIFILLAGGLARLLSVFDVSLPLGLVSGVSMIVGVFLIVVGRVVYDERVRVTVRGYHTAFDMYVQVFSPLWIGSILAGVLLFPANEWGLALTTLGITIATAYLVVYVLYYWTKLPLPHEIRGEITNRHAGSVTPRTEEENDDQGASR